MRIDLNSRTPETPGNIRAEKSSAKQTPASARVSGLSADEARLSSDQVRVHGLQAAASGAPEIRQHKVAALQSAIANGTYDVGARQIADAIIDHLQQGAEKFSRDWPSLLLIG